MAGVIARGKTSPVKEIQQFLFILRLHIISLQAIFKTAIQILPVNPNNTGRIPWALHPSFNLQRKYARFQNLGKNIQCTKVFHAENTFLILFIDGGPIFLFCHPVGQAAGLGAASSVAAAASDQTAHKTLA